MKKFMMVAAMFVFFAPESKAGPYNSVSPAYRVGEDELAKARIQNVRGGMPKPETNDIFERGVRDLRNKHGIDPYGTLIYPEMPDMPPSAGRDAARCAQRARGGPFTDPPTEGLYKDPVTGVPMNKREARTKALEGRTAARMDPDWKWKSPPTVKPPTGKPFWKSLKDLCKGCFKHL